MSIFTGKQYKGAMRDHRLTKRKEAEARNAASEVVNCIECLGRHDRERACR